MWAPVEGRYGRTRDGRKVGPMVWGGGYPQYPWTCRREDVRDIGIPFWTEDGYYRSGDTDHPLDLVAEWVDDVGPVRQRTVTEIVPGLHDGVEVQVFQVPDCENPDIPPSHALTVSFSAGDPTADELDAAARVLTQLAEALRHG